MKIKRILIRHLMKSLGEVYWMATPEQRLYRLKTIMPIKPTKTDYQREESL